jgi:hypothetical protein
MRRRIAATPPFGHPFNPATLSVAQQVTQMANAATIGALYVCQSQKSSPIEPCAALSNHGTSRSANGII